jgi:hypothetical protein
MRREINRTLDRFVPAAVLRRAPMEAYELSTPALREGASRKEWERGEIPVYPASVQAPYNGWNLNYSVKGNVNFDLMLKTTKQEKEISSISYNVDLKRMGNRWLVESFFPVAQFRRTSLENGTKVVASYDFVPLQYQGSSGTAEQGRKVFAYSSSAPRRSCSPSCWASSERSTSATAARGANSSPSASRSSGRRRAESAKRFPRVPAGDLY